MAEAIEHTSAGTGLTWKEVCKNPHLRDLPYKIETNEYNQIVMTPPPSPIHGARQSKIARLLARHLSEGVPLTECPVRTAKGTKVPDVGWCSGARWEQMKEEVADSPVAPEICVEVLSPSNTEEEIEERRQLYFACGAEEVWTCDAGGRMHFFDADGRQDASLRAPGFPQRIEV